MKKLTDIEKIVRDLLFFNNIKYKREYKVGNYPVDFYLPDYNLSIQCDGCFHHQCISCYKKQKVKYARQIFQKQRDKSCIAYHMYHKINILRLKGCDILSSKEKTLIKINKVIKKIINGEKVYDFK